MLNRVDSNALHQVSVDPGHTHALAHNFAELSGSGGSPTVWQAVRAILAAMFGKKKVPATATVLADEGYLWASNGQKTTKQHEKYIIEVHPEGAAAFRVEAKAWVGWLSRPQVGDTVNVLWKPGTEHVEIVIEGDIRYDDKLRGEKQDQADAALREQLLNAPPGTPVPTQAGAAADAGADVCPTCGQPRVAGAAFCSHCGTPMR